jgi:hypothetical protein
MTTYVDANGRFKNEIAENTRKTKESLALIQAATQQYNTNEQFVLLDTATITLPANTYHSYSFVILSGKVNITEAGVTINDVNHGFSAEATATTLLKISITFVGKDSGTKLIVKTIR